MNDESKLLEKLRRIEALHAGATTAGERGAAAEARRRIQARLSGLRDAIASDISEAEEIRGELGAAQEG